MKYALLKKEHNREDLALNGAERTVYKDNPIAVPDHLINDKLLLFNTKEEAIAEVMKQIMTETIPNPKPEKQDKKKKVR